MPSSTIATPMRGEAGVRRQERRPDRDRVGHEEVAHVLAQDGRVGQHPSPVVALARWVHTATPVTNMASVASMNGAPRMAPTPTLWPVSELAASRAREEDRDDRDHRLGQRRADGRQHGADGALGQVEVVAEPLDAVGEQLRAGQDDEAIARTAEVDDVHHGEGYGPASGGAMAVARELTGRPSAGRGSGAKVLRARTAAGPRVGRA